MKSIAFGQYYPSDSIMHKLDPRIKIIMGVLYIVVSFLCKNIVSFAILACSALLLILISKIPVKIVLKSIKAVIFIMAFTAVLNIFWTTGTPEQLLFSWKFINVYTNTPITKPSVTMCVRSLMRSAPKASAPGFITRFLTGTTKIFWLTATTRCAVWIGKS